MARTRSMWVPVVAIAAASVGAHAPGADALGSDAAIDWTDGNIEQGHLTPTDVGGNENFGASVAIQGDTAVVGAIFDSTPSGGGAGSVYVYERSGNAWTEQAHLFASDAAEGDTFGYPVAVAGDTIVAGAAHDDTVAGLDAGSVYVFVRSGTVWTQQAHLFASDGAAFDRFGTSVAIAGDTIAVGADFDHTAGGARAGSAYVFERSGTAWTERAHLFASDGAAEDNFGNAVAVSGRTVLVGSYQDDTAGGEDAGSAYVFTRSGGSWQQEAHLFSSLGPNVDWFGRSVALSGDTAVIGGFGGSVAGSAHVFARSGTMWVLQALLLPSDGVQFDWFGQAVAISGDTVVVGSRGDDTAAGGQAGSAYVFTRSGTAWSERSRLFASDGGEFDEFGSAVAVDSDTVLAGAPGYDFAPPGVQAGAAQVFVPSGLSVSDAIVSEGDAGSKKLKFTVTLPAPSETSVQVTFTTTDGTATAGSDYKAVVKTVTLAPGTTSQRVSVTVLGDVVIEPHETVVVTLSNPVGSTVFDGAATGTIRNDDG